MLSVRRIQNHRSPWSVIGELNTSNAHFSSCLSVFSASFTVDVTFLCLSSSPLSTSHSLLSCLECFPNFFLLFARPRLRLETPNSQAAPLLRYNEIGCTQIERCHFLQLSTDYRGDLFRYLRGSRGEGDGDDLG